VSEDESSSRVSLDESRVRVRVREEIIREEMSREEIRMSRRITERYKENCVRMTS
jgi:hypothetical protein